MNGDVAWEGREESVGEVVGELASRNGMATGILSTDKPGFTHV